MPESKWLEFVHVEDKPKTKVWEVKRKAVEIHLDGISLGYVKYFGQWRQYAFFPHEGTVWHGECLQDITLFLNYQNDLRKVI